MRAPARMDPVTVPETLDLPPARRRWSTGTSRVRSEDQQTKSRQFSQYSCVCSDCHKSMTPAGKGTLCTAEPKGGNDNAVVLAIADQ